MRVVLAGATGALGNHLVPALVAAGHEVIAIVRDPSAPNRHRRRWAGTIAADVLDRSALLGAAAGIRADAVVHELTALKRLPLRYGDLDATNVLRTTGTRNLVALAEQVGATRMVTQSFLGGYGYGDHGPDLLTEAAPFAPHGRTAGLERVLAALREAERLTRTTAGLDGIVLRYGLFYGPEPLATMLPLLAKRRLPVPSGGGGTHSYIHLPDAATATVAALERGRPGEAYNVCDAEPVRWADFVDAAAGAFGLPRPMRVPERVLRVAPYGHAVMMSRIPLSGAKAGRELGFRPSAPTYRDGLALSRAAMYAEVSMH